MGNVSSVYAGGRRAEKRFLPSNPLKDIKVWRDDTRVSLRKAAGLTSRGTFANDAARYLMAVAAMPTFSERRKHIKLLTDKFRQRRRNTIATNEIDVLLNRWLDEERLASSTVKHRRTALLYLWHRLDGRYAVNPVDERRPGSPSTIRRPRLLGCVQYVVCLEIVSTCVCEIGPERPQAV